MTYNTSISYNDIKFLCEKAAQSCMEKITNDTRLSNEISIVNQEKELQQNSLIVDKTPKIEGLVRDWYDLKIGEKYYMWAKKTSAKNRKIYILKYIISELNGDILNICVMKQCGGPKTKMFTLTESDCEHIGIEFESGLEVYPVNICWVKYKKHADAEKMNGANIKMSPNEYIMPEYNKNYDYNKNHYTDYKNEYICGDQIWRVNL